MIVSVGVAKLVQGRPYHEMTKTLPLTPDLKPHLPWSWLRFIEASRLSLWRRALPRLPLRGKVDRATRACTSSSLLSPRAMQPR